MATFSQQAKLRVSYTVVVALDDFEEDGGTVLLVLREDLQQIAVIVIVDHDVQLLQLSKEENKKVNNIKDSALGKNPVRIQKYTSSGDFNQDFQ